MKAEYLFELLQENKTVILPGIGAFVQNDSTTQPYIFNPYLKFNDGMLVAYIAKKENLGMEEAGKKLEVFSAGIQTLLESGRDVVIQRLGKIKSDASGKIEFTHDPSLTENQQEKIIVPEIKTETPKTEVPKIETPKVELPKPELPKEEKVNSIPPISIQEEKITKPEIAAEKKIEKEIKKSPVEKKKKERKKRKLLIPILLLLLLGGGGTAGYLFRNEIMHLFSGQTESKADEKKETKKESLKQEQPASPGDSTFVEEMDSSLTESPIAETENPELITEESPVKEEVAPKKNNSVTTTPSAPAQSGNFYVIIGCYSNESNISAISQKASEKGHTASDIGVYGGLHHISVYSTSDLSDAAAKASSLRSDFPNAWVMQVR